jgi:uncharacterized YccA/Bax inhibitor family protein
VLTTDRFSQCTQPREKEQGRLEKKKLWEENMGLMDMILCPLAICFAIGSAIVGSKTNLFCILSYMCCCIMPLRSIFDIAERIMRNDISGIMDIYPTMGNIFLIVFLVVTVLNGIALLRK